MAARTSSWHSGRRHIPRESGIPCTPTGTTCSTGLFRGDRASGWALPAAGRGPRHIPASTGAARGRAQAGTVRCLGPGIGRRRPDRLSVEPPPRPGAVRRLSEPGHPSGPRSSGTGGLSAGADAPGRRGHRRARVLSASCPAAIKSRGGRRRPADCRGAEGGLEPPHPCGHMTLNHARLPIPPLRPEQGFHHTDTDIEVKRAPWQMRR